MSISFKHASLALIVGEFALGTWLLAGISPRYAKKVISATFALFCLYSLATGTSGQASCGCFGTVRISPWSMFAFDLFVLLALLSTRTIAVVPIGFRASLLRFVLAGCFATILGLASSRLARVPIGDPSLEGLEARDGSLAILKPESWIGLELPIASHLRFDSARDGLSSGKWLVVLYDDHCAHCKVVVPEIVRWSIDDPEPRVAFLTVTKPVDSPDRLVVIPMELSDRLITGHLDETRDWFVETPALFALESGRVVREGWPPRSARPSGTRSR